MMKFCISVIFRKSGWLQEGPAVQGRVAAVTMKCALLLVVRAQAERSAAERGRVAAIHDMRLLIARVV